MRYIMTFIWSLLIGTALAYVLTSMAGEPFILAEAGILAVGITIVAIILGDGMLKVEEQ